MPHLWVSVLAAAVCCTQPLPGAEPIIVADDGSVSGRWSCGSFKQQLVVLRFGLPRTGPVRMWREGGMLRALWVTNGIRYTQTVLLTNVRQDEVKPTDSSHAIPLLLVNVEGENTNSEYAEATAEILLEIGGRRQELELKAGSIRRRTGGLNPAIGTLEIPESGIRLAYGEKLCFSGNMPPSLRGSMTLKIPLKPLDGEKAIEGLNELEFAVELRRALKVRDAPGATQGWVLMFAHEQQN